MDLQDSPLPKASRLALIAVRTEEAGIGVADVLEYVEHDDWEAVLLLLEDLGDARPQPPELWVECRAPLGPGRCTPERLPPLGFEHWRHLKPGDVITVHEMWPPVGTARIAEIIPPVATGF